MELYFLSGYSIDSHDDLLSVLHLNISAYLENYSNLMSCADQHTSPASALCRTKGGAAAPHLGRWNGHIPIPAADAPSPSTDQPPLVCLLNSIHHGTANAAQLHAVKLVFV